MEKKLESAAKKIDDKKKVSEKIKSFMDKLTTKRDALFKSLESK